MSFGVLGGSVVGRVRPRGGARPLGIDMTAFLGCPGSLGFEKTSPLPVGRYWIDVTGEQNITDFFGALNTAKDYGVVDIENVEVEGTDTSFSAVLNRLMGGPTVPQAWVLFRVTGVGSIAIDATRYGYPTKAPDCVTTKDQTSTATEAQTEVDKEATIPTWAWVAGGAVVFLVLAHAVGEVAGAVKTVEEAHR